MASPAVTLAQMLAQNFTLANLTALLSEANKSAPGDPMTHCSDGLCHCNIDDLFNNRNAACSLISGGAHSLLREPPLP